MSEFMTAAKASEIPPGASKLVQLGTKPVAIFNIGGNYFAIDDRCPHRGGPLSEGTLKDGIISCPWHGACFELSTGKALSGPTSHGLNLFRTKVEGDDILVEIYSANAG